MIDANAIQRRLAQQAEQKLVEVLEHIRQLHTEPGQIVDVEKPAVIDIVRGHAKVSRTPALIADQAIQSGPTRRVASAAVEASYRRGNGGAYLIALLSQLRHFGFQLGGMCSNPRPPFRKVRKSVSKPL